MQQIKDVYFFNLHNFATSMIFNGIQIKINFVRLFVRLLALQQVPLLDRKTPCTCNTGEATRHYLNTCCHDGDDDVLHLVDEDTAGLLRLLQLQRLHLYVEEVHLRILPFPPTSLLTVLKLDLLHERDELVGPVIVDGLLLEELIVQHLAAAQEKRHPKAVEQTARKEDGKNELVVEQQHHSEHHEGEHGEGHAQCLAGEEVVHAAVVVHPLHEVAHELGVEERHRQFQQFDEEVAHQRDVDPHGDMQQQPPADEVDGRTAEGKHQLTEQYQPDKADVPVLDAHVDDGLREEWQDELQQTAHDHAQYDLSEIAFVLLHIAEEETERPWILILFTLIVLLVGIESWCGLQKHRYTLLFPVRPRADPMTLELLKTIFYKAFARVSDIELLTLFDFV